MTPHKIGLHYQCFANLRDKRTSCARTVRTRVRARRAYVGDGTEP
jgi:hypothetical protein